MSEVKLTKAQRRIATLGRCIDRMLADSERQYRVWLETQINQIRVMPDRAALEASHD